MDNYTLDNQTVSQLLLTLKRHPEWDRCDPVIMEQALDIPVAHVSEEEEGWYMQRTDRVLEVVGAMQFLIAMGLVEGGIRPNKDMFICSGIKLTSKGLDHVRSLD